MDYDVEDMVCPALSWAEIQSTAGKQHRCFEVSDAAIEPSVSDRRNASITHPTQGGYPRILVSTWQVDRLYSSYGRLIPSTIDIISFTFDTIRRCSGRGIGIDNEEASPVQNLWLKENVSAQEPNSLTHGRTPPPRQRPGAKGSQAG